MSDSSYASMTIGGILNKKDVAQFLEIARDEFYQTFSNPSNLPSEIMDEIEEGNVERATKWLKDQAGKGCLEIEDCEATNGEFSDIQNFCEKHGLSYCTKYAGCNGAYDPGIKYWRPGMEYPRDICTNEDGSITVHKSALTYLLNVISEITLKNAPKYIGSEDGDYTFVAAQILKHGEKDVQAIIESWLSFHYPSPDDDIEPFIIKED